MASFSEQEVALLLRKERLRIEIARQRDEWRQRVQPIEGWMAQGESGYHQYLHWKPYLPVAIATLTLTLMLRRGKAVSTLKTAYRVFRRWRWMRSLVEQLWQSIK